ASFVSHILLQEYIAAGVVQPSVISTVKVEGNSLTSSLPSGAKYLWLQTGNGVSVANNDIRDLGFANPVAIQLTGNTANTGYSGPLSVVNNGIVGTTNKYALQNTTPVRVRDLTNGLTVATLPRGAGAG